jgi:tetratricopeptide (TPR) repeat protein
MVEGTVQDAQHKPIASAAVSLEGSDANHTLSSTTDAEGRFHFQSVPAGSYMLRVKLAGYSERAEGPFVLHDHETKSVELLLTKPSASSPYDASSALAFSDEPRFTVAGVTDTTVLGGHGSGPVVRNSNALSKETASLGHSDTYGVHAEEDAIRASLAREDNAELHAQLAEIEEATGRPVEAVKDYQLAAEMQPTEPHLFSWGAELLLHHAPEPAIEVFTKGHRLYPQSSRMMLGLGAAWYAQRAEEKAVQIFLQACDVNPSDPTPYLFLGRVQVTQRVLPAGWTDRMKRFVRLHPENAMAHYLYAVALIKQSNEQSDFNAAEAELNTAIQLDPHLGDAYLQLGIARAAREDYTGAVAAFKKAIENTSFPDDAHYRLAQVYRRKGESEKAKQEIAEFKKLEEEKEAEAGRERHEIPQFVYTLREQTTPNTQTSPEPK